MGYTGTCSPVTLFSLIVCNMYIYKRSSFILLYTYNIFSLTFYIIIVIVIILYLNEKSTDLYNIWIYILQQQTHRTIEERHTHTHTNITEDIFFGERERETLRFMCVCVCVMFSLFRPVMGLYIDTLLTVSLLLIFT